jgi:cytochrome P450
MSGKERSSLYDPFFETASDDPYPVYRVLRDRHPVFRNEERDFWALSRFSDVQVAARDWRTFSNSEGVDLDDVGRLIGAGNFLDADPPTHDALRRVVHASFTPRAVQAFDPIVREEARGCLAAARHAEEMDLAEELAWRLPVSVICRLLGFSSSETPLLTKWLSDFSLRSAPRSAGDPGLPDAAVEAASRLRDFVQSAVCAKRKADGDDLLSVVARATVDGKDLGDEAVGVTLLLLLAGTDTTASLISNSLLAFSRNPDQWTVLAENPSLLPAAIEELLRYESPIQADARVTTREYRLHDTDVPAGARVLLLFGAANRDDRRFPDPDRLDVRRAPRRHLAFGEGIHFCLGAPLARLEARVLFEELIAVVKSVHVTGRPVWLRSGTTRGLAQLPGSLVLRARFPQYATPDTG